MTSLRACGGAAEIGDHEKLDAGTLLQRFAGEMGERPPPRCGVREFAGLLFGERDEFRQGLGAKRRHHRQQEWLQGDEPDRHEVARYFERQIGLEPRQRHEGR